MKAYDIYKRTLALMFEREGEDRDFRDNFCNILTAVAAECLPYENSVRCAEGEEKLAKAPEITDMGDVLPYCDELCTVAIPNGVAAYFAENDGEGYASAVYRERFVNALYEVKKCIFTDVEDVYGGECI